jgi:hypothetical protein
VTETCIISGSLRSSRTGYAVVRLRLLPLSAVRSGVTHSYSLLLLYWPCTPVAHRQQLLGCTSTPLSWSPRKTTCLWTHRSRSPVHQAWDGHKWVTYLLCCVKCGFSHCATCWLARCKCSRVWWSIAMHMLMVGCGQKNSFSIAFRPFFKSCYPPYHIDMRSMLI